MWIVVVGFLGILGLFTYAGYRRAVSEDRAKLRYREALALLKAEPRNPDLRQQALARGRAYVAIARSDEGDPLFDEVTLMNDISAVSAGAGSAPLAEDTTEVEAKLRTLSSLKDKGLISDSEFELRHSQILERI